MFSLPHKHRASCVLYATNSCLAMTSPRKRFGQVDVATVANTLFFRILRSDAYCVGRLLLVRERFAKPIVQVFVEYDQGSTTADRLLSFVKFLVDALIQSAVVRPSVTLGGFRVVTSVREP